MLWIAAFILLLFALSVAWMARNAPEGYEDKNGFHYGQKPSSNKE